ncbi:MAG TPA: hypothetical protein EYP90_12510 [Chromatiaceae bacterium]|nr:hypothetical protein [Chromatiaceae bacterium]
MIRMTFLLMLLAAAASASSIRHINLSELTSTAQLVFEGIVLEKRVLHEKGSRTIRTQVTFEVLEVLKGGFSGERLTLSFLGGRTSDLVLEVSDLRMPRVGERGIYFVESLERPLVNPLVGWHQGHYLIEEEAGRATPVVKTLQGRAVFDLVDDMRGPGDTFVSRPGSARGVILEQSGEQSRPMTPAEFKRRLLRMMGE